MGKYGRYNGERVKNYGLPASVAKRGTLVIIVNIEAILLYARGPYRCLKMKVFWLYASVTSPVN